MERNARKRRVAQQLKAKKIEDSKLLEVSDDEDNESDESVSSDV